MFLSNQIFLQEVSRNRLLDNMIAKFRETIVDGIPNVRIPYVITLFLLVGWFPCISLVAGWFSSIYSSNGHRVFPWITLLAIQ